MKLTKILVSFAGYAITALSHRFLYDGTLEQFAGFVLVHALWTTLMLKWWEIQVYTD